VGATKCEHCGGAMPLLKRRHARYCSTRCRVAAHRARRALPRELTSRRRWVRRDATKAPRTVTGRRASSTNPATWSSYREAVKSRAGVGLGYVLAGDGIVCLDLDHCLKGGRLAPWAQAILDRCPPTYIEVSPSGDGLHVWGLGTVGRGRRVRMDGGQVEVYDRGRYMTITRQRYGQAPAKLGRLDDVIEALT
jgi:primase-polymerase (primpol)-like protein